MSVGEMERWPTLVFVLNGLVLGQNRLHQPFEFRYSLSDCGPDNIGIYGKVPVHKMVSHPDDCPPWYSVMTIPEFAGKLPGCLPMI